MSRDDDDRKCWVSRLPHDITEEEIRIVFNTYGKVTDAKVHEKDGGFKFAFVTYETKRAAEVACQVLNDVYRFREESKDPIVVEKPKGPKARERSPPAVRRDPIRPPAARRERSFTPERGRSPPPRRGPPPRADFDDRRDGFARSPERFRAGDRLGDRDFDRGYDRGVDRGGDRGFARGDERFDREGRGNDRDFDRPMPRDRGPDRELDRGRGDVGRGNDREFERGYDRDNDRPINRRDDFDRGGRNGNDRDIDDRLDRRDDRDRGGDRRDFGGGKGKGGDQKPGVKLYVANLPDDIDKESLEYVFKNYGRVHDLHIMTGRSKSGQAACFVVYSEISEAKKCMAAMSQGYEIRPGQGEILVKYADEGKGKGKGDDRNRPY